MDNKQLATDKEVQSHGEGTFGNHPLQSNGFSGAPSGSPAQLSPAPFQLSASPVEASPSADEGESVEFAISAPSTTAGPGSDSSVQRSTGTGPIQRTEEPRFRFEINVPRTMTQAEYKVYVQQQLFGRQLENLSWTLVHETYSPDNNPYVINVAASLYRQHLGQANNSRGIETDENGQIEGAAARSEEFTTLERSVQAQINAEINRRYWTATGLPEGSAVDPDDESAVALWRMYRDQVLFQRDYIRNLPESVQQLIRFSIQGRPMDYQELDRLYDLARMIEALPAERVRDYASRINASTTSLDEFEASIRNFNTEMDGREDAQAEHRANQTAIYGMEETYQLYLRHMFYLRNTHPSAYIAAIFVDMPFEQVERELNASLQAHGFESIAAFRTYINDFLDGFEAQAALTFDDTMARYDGTMYREQQRYQDQGELTALQQAIQSGNNDGFPILNDEGMPDDKRVPRDAWAAASLDELQGMVQSYLATRRTDISEARGRVSDDPSLIYRIEGMFPLFYSSQGFAQGSIYDMIVQNKIQEDAIMRLVVGILGAIAAIALTVVSLGTATPAIVAAGAAAGAFGLSAYFAYEEYQNYVIDSDLADVGLIDDPSVVWLVIAIVGATVDMAAAVKAVRALAPAARVLNAGGDVSEFTRAVRTLEELGEIDARMARAAQRAATARGTFRAAADDLGRLMSRVSANPFLDPEIYFAMVRMGIAKISEGIAEFHQFVLQLKAAKTAAGFADELTPEELTRAKEAWEAALRYVNSADEPVDIMSDAANPRVIGRFSRGNFLELISRRARLYGGNTIRLAEGRTTTIVGTMDAVGDVRIRGAQMPGLTMQGANPGGINSLFSPRWDQIRAAHQHILDAGDTATYWRTVTDEFWDSVNGPWVQEAIARGDQFRLVSNPSDARNLVRTLEDGSEMPTIFARELELLRRNGYTILDDGMAIPPGAAGN